MSIAEEAGGRLERQTLQRGIEISLGTLHADGGVIDAIAAHEGHAAGSGQRHGAVHRVQDEDHVAAAGIRIAERNGVAFKRVERQDLVLLDGLSTRHTVDRRIVHCGDVDGYGLAIGLRSAAGIAVVVDRYRQQHAVGAVERSLERHAGGGNEGVDIAQAAGQRERTGTRTIHRDPAAGDGAQDAAWHREGRSD